MIAMQHIPILGTVSFGRKHLKKFFGPSGNVQRPALSCAGIE